MSILVVVAVELNMLQLIVSIPLGTDVDRLDVKYVASVPVPVSVGEGG